jgi:hypothetical protein
MLGVCRSARCAVSDAGGITARAERQVSMDADGLDSPTAAAPPRKGAACLTRARYAAAERTCSHAQARARASTHTHGACACACEDAHARTLAAGASRTRSPPPRAASAAGRSARPLDPVASPKRRPQTATAAAGGSHGNLTNGYPRVPSVPLVSVRTGTSTAATPGQAVVQQWPQEPLLLASAPKRTPAELQASLVSLQASVRTNLKLAETR